MRCVLGIAIAFTTSSVIACTPAPMAIRDVGPPSGTAIESAAVVARSVPVTGVPSPASQTTSSVITVAIGRSVRGRNIVAQRFGTGTRRVLIVGGVHGDEYGADVAAAFEETLRRHPESVPTNTEIHVIECLNPDGRAVHLRGNAHEVDLNLNMPAANWKRTLSRQTTARKRGLNGGTAPGSEPESKALIAYLENDFELVISLHSAGGIVDWDGPGGEAIARRMARITRMRAEHPPVQPYATGTMGQYIPEKWAIPVITIELSSRDLGRPLLDAILGAAGDERDEPSRP